MEPGRFFDRERVAVLRVEPRDIDRMEKVPALVLHYENRHARPLLRDERQHGVVEIRVDDDQAFSISRSIHAMRKSTMPCCRSAGMATPCGTFHHIARQSRQQQAQACCATNTGWPRIGVCLPSLGGLDGARRVLTKSSQCARINASPLSATYFLSASERWKRLLNFDFASCANAVS